MKPKPTKPKTKPKLAGKDIQSFVIELTALTKKYGIAIGGCGCCGSPSLNDAVTEETAQYHVTKSMDHLEFCKSGDYYYDDKS